MRATAKDVRTTSIDSATHKQTHLSPNRILWQEGEALLQAATPTCLEALVTQYVDNRFPDRKGSKRMKNSHMEAFVMRSPGIFASWSPVVRRPAAHGSPEIG